jgi:hypothetical protein
MRVPVGTHSITGQSAAIATVSGSARTARQKFTSSPSRSFTVSGPVTVPGRVNSVAREPAKGST